MPECLPPMILISTPNGDCARCADPSRSYQLTEAFRQDPSLCKSSLRLAYLFGNLGSPIFNEVDALLRDIIEQHDFGPMLAFIDHALAQGEAEAALSAARLVTVFASPRADLDVLQRAFEAQVRSLQRLDRPDEAAATTLLYNAVAAASHSGENIQPLSETLLLAVRDVQNPVIQANVPFLGSLFELEAQALQANNQPLEAMRVLTIANLLRQQPVTAAEETTMAQ